MWFSTIRRAGKRGTMLMITTYRARMRIDDTPRNNLCRSLAMSFALPIRLASSRNAQMLGAAFVLMTLAVFISSFHRPPRPWRVQEVPVAFWSWRSQTPSAADVHAAVEKTGTRTIFLRAGQIDYQEGKMSRIRSVGGPLPTEIDLQLVYNATRSLLAHLDKVDEQALANVIAASFASDSRRAATENARVTGLQIDIDVPTRLLSRYERMLRALRKQLPPGVPLSITGLPTWMQSSELRATLAAVDFWVPQFYGAEIPLRADLSIPISAPAEVERFVNQARELNKPFYAGLAAYNYALLYSAAGALVALRGDLDPAAIAADANFELEGVRTFAQAPGEWRYTYRARANDVIDGLVLQAGDVLVVDLPSAESLRASARIVRELGGEKLLGICVFRLPGADDPATLTIEQVAAALADQAAAADFKVTFTSDPGRSRTAWLAIQNAGTANAITDFKLEVEVGPGAIEFVSVSRTVTVETICRESGVGQPSEVPCSPKRANVIRLAAPGLRSGQTLRASLTFDAPVPNSLSVAVEAPADDGETYCDQLKVNLE